MTIFKNKIKYVNNSKLKIQSGGADFNELIEFIYNYYTNSLSNKRKLPSFNYNTNTNTNGTQTFFLDIIKILSDTQIIYNAEYSILKKEDKYNSYTKNCIIVKNKKNEDYYPLIWSEVYQKWIIIIDNELYYILNDDLNTYDFDIKYYNIFIENYNKYRLISSFEPLFLPRIIFKYLKNSIKKSLLYVLLHNNYLINLLLQKIKISDHLKDFEKYLFFFISYFIGTIIDYNKLIIISNNENNQNIIENNYLSHSSNLKNFLCLEYYKKELNYQKLKLRIVLDINSDEELDKLSEKYYLLSKIIIIKSKNILNNNNFSYNSNTYYKKLKIEIENTKIFIYAIYDINLNNPNNLKYFIDFIDKIINPNIPNNAESNAESSISFISSKLISTTNSIPIKNFDDYYDKNMKKLRKNEKQKENIEEEWKKFEILIDDEKANVNLKKKFLRKFPKHNTSFIELKVKKAALKVLKKIGKNEAKEKWYELISNENKDNPERFYKEAIKEFVKLKKNVKIDLNYEFKTIFNQQVKHLKKIKKIKKIKLQKSNAANAEKICKTLKDAELLKEFLNNLYKLLNKFYKKGDENKSAGVYPIFIKNTVNNNHENVPSEIPNTKSIEKFIFNPLLFNAIVNGRLNKSMPIKNIIASLNQIISTK